MNRGKEQSWTFKRLTKPSWGTGDFPKSRFSKQMCSLFVKKHIPAAFICSKACDIIAEDTFSVASQHSAGMTSTQRAMFLDFPTEIGRSQNSHFLFLNIARRPHTTQSDLIFLNLSQASCMLGRVDIKWVTFMRAGGGYVNSNLFHEKSPLAIFIAKARSMMHSVSDFSTPLAVHGTWIWSMHSWIAKDAL